MRAPSLGLVALTCAATAWWAAGAQRRALEGGGRRRSHRVQHGHCSYTFVLPEADPPPCSPAGPANALLQRDSPAGATHAGHGASQRLRHLERVLENSTQWLLKVGRRVEWGDVGGGLPPPPPVPADPLRLPACSGLLEAELGARGIVPTRAPWASSWPVCTRQPTEGLGAVGAAVAGGCHWGRVPVPSLPRLQSRLGWLC